MRKKKLIIIINFFLLCLIINLGINIIKIIKDLEMGCGRRIQSRLQNETRKKKSLLSSIKLKSLNMKNYNNDHLVV